MNKTLVLATHNPKKLQELQTLVLPLGVRLQSLSDLGVGEAAEPHCTFLENALAKARHAAQATGLPALADDSGLCVDALGGEPGVRSARYALDAGQASAEWDRQRLDAANNAWLLQRMQHQHTRSAHFICVLVAVRHAADPEPLVAQGRWSGEILAAPCGEGGFGYDPLLGWPQQGISVAQLDARDKNTRSHRAQASRQLLDMLRENWLSSESAQWSWMEHR